MAIASGVALASAADEPQPRQSGKKEVVEVKVVQVDVSVLPPRGAGYSSVPGLTLDHFDIRLDGKRLTPEQMQAVRLDALCETGPKAGAPAEGATEPAPPPPQPILVVVDFNYVDSRGRFRVAEALEKLAETAADRPEIYKVYGITRQVRMLTDGFTKDPRALRQAAMVVRGTAFRGGEFVGPDTEGIPEVKEQTLRSEVDALGGLPFQVFSSPADAAGAEIAMTELYFEARQAYSPEASVAALEAILRAHSGLPGSKGVILFTSEAFRILRTERFDQIALGLRELAMQGFRIWTVDVEGLSRGQSGKSEMLSLLAHDSGGRSIRKTGNLALAFKGISEQLSCHYLFSLPVPSRPDKTERHLLTIKIDTDKYPDMWNYRIVAPSHVTITDERTALKNRRIAALLSPADFDTPPVTTTLDYPVSAGEKQILPVRVRTPLAALTWLPAKEGGVKARILVDALVERDTGRGSLPVCQIGAEKTGAIELKLKRTPRPGYTGGLTVELPCSFKKDGLYVARGVMTDMETDLSGAGRSTAVIRRTGEKQWEALALRVQAASGRDFLWRPGGGPARKDRGRQAWRQIGTKSFATSDDRIALRYVLCGPQRSEAQNRVRHLLLRLGRESGAQTVESFSPDALMLADKSGEGSFCSAAMVVVPEYSLDPGSYGFVIVSPEASPKAAAEALGAPEDELPPGVLGRATFVVK